MASFKIRKFTPKDIPQVMALQGAYQEAYPFAATIPGETYLSAGFENGKNIFCAFDEGGALQGYAPLFPNLVAEPELPHTIWAEVKINPGLPARWELKDALFARVMSRAKQITQAFPDSRTNLTFQYHPSEIFSIEYLLSRGGCYTESAYRMLRDLAQPIPSLPPPENITVRRWRMESKTEQRAYVRARNEAFPEAPVTLADWQYFLSSPAWQAGIAIAAFDGGEVAGSMLVYGDEALSRRTGKKAGVTEYIFVRKKWRRRGIAAYLITQGLQYLKEHDREAAYLEVRLANHAALELYHRLGYQVVDENRFYVLEL